MVDGVIEYLDLTSVVHEPLLEFGLPLGMRGRQLMSIPTGDTSFLVRVGPQWRHVDSGYYESDLQILVLSGSVTVGDTTLGPKCFCHLPAHCQTGPWRSSFGCDMLLMFKEPPRHVKSHRDGPRANQEQRIDRLDIGRMSWAAMPGYEGRSQHDAGPMLYHITIHEDPKTKAYTYLVRQDGGWNEPKIESHTSWEELLLLEGDYLMGHNGLVRAGTYIYRPGGVPHGPQATRSGSVWLARGNTIPDFVWSDESWAHDAVRDYLEAPLDAHIGDPAPWGNWSADPREEETP